MTRFIALLIAGIFSFYVSANNVTISNTLLTGQNTASNYTLVEFDATWENSWRTSTNESNWDALWIIVKYRLSREKAWHQATLHYTDGTGSGDGHTEPTDAEISSSDDNGSNGAHGVFLYAAANKSLSTANYTGIQLRWDYGADGLADDDSVAVCVMAVEMVYVPQGPFYMGDGDGARESSYAFHTTSNQNFRITTTLVDSIITDANGYDEPFLESYPGIGIDGDGGLDRDGDDVIDNANFPTGYEAFYIMKYETSQGMYTEYLNRLTQDQSSGIYFSTTSVRETISGTYPNFAVSSPDRAMPHMTMNSVMSIADWFALRPMTEFEYEKACRGDQPAFSCGYAWGNDSLYSTAYTLSNDGSTNASITNMGTANLMGNASYSTTDGSINGPLRNGIFAASATTASRNQTGASYYGAMELSGNLYEMCINTGLDTCTYYEGIHGDGELGANGESNVITWPYDQIRALKPRGGCYNDPETAMQVSDRNYATNTSASFRSSEWGARMVRTAP